jgi:hypothetical protein
MGTNFKFFSQNKIDVNSTFAFTSASTTLSQYLYDNNYNFRLTSIGSNDATPEVYTITFGSVKTGNRIFIGYHNFKNFTIQYSINSGGTYNDFSTPISETTNTANYNYYEFDSVSAITNLKITANTTQTTNAEKILGQFRLMDQLGEVSANPYSIDPTYNENSFSHRKSDGGNVYVQFGRKMSMTISFDDATSADVDIFRALKDRFAPFYVFPNGGDSSRTQEPFRVQDMFLVNYTNPYRPGLRGDFLYDAGTEIELVLEEV